MPTDPTIAFGILKCRDLVQLYYGARLVADVRQTFVNYDGASPTPQLLLAQDPRRVRYEIWMNGGSSTATIEMGQLKDFDSQQTMEALFLAGNTFRIERSFLTDLDAVTFELYAQGGGANVDITVRETFLTPAPVDEGP
jgi:hypothetical protein